MIEIYHNRVEVAFFISILQDVSRYSRLQGKGNGAEDWQYLRLLFWA